MLRKLFSLIMVVVIIAAIGYSRGWFQAQSDSSSSQTNISVTVDKDKIKADAQSATREARDLGVKIRNKVEPASQPSAQP